MARLLIDVMVPANGKTYEFRLDGAMTTGEAKGYIAEYIVQAERGAVTFSEGLLLGDGTTEKRLEDNISLYEGGVRSGHILTLV